MNENPSGVVPPNPYYDHGGITIYHGDCRAVLPFVKGVDLIFTSPPYNKALRVDGNWTGVQPSAARMGRLSEGYGEHDDALPMDEYVNWQRSALRYCWRSLSPEGAIFYNHKPRLVYRDPSTSHGVWLPLALNPGLPVRQILIWVTGAGVTLVPTAFAPSHEWIIVFARDAWRLRSRAASAAGDAWIVPPESSSGHPAPFPVALPARAIEATAPNLVADPFMGSGTTLRAAKDAGVRAIGIEIEERYCEIAAKRLAQEVLAL